MTEREWRACDDPEAMLGFLSRRATARKRRLFVCACARRLWHLLTEDARRSVEAGERFADGRAEVQEMWDVSRNVYEEARVAGRGRSPAGFVAQYTCFHMLKGADVAHVARTAVRAMVESLVDDGGLTEKIHAGYAINMAESRRLDRVAVKEVAHEAAERAALAGLLRCLFAPFRGAAKKPARPRGAAVDLAREIYESRAFERLPALADALTEAGGADPAAVAHCREPGEHALGCWVLDLALGKK
jgi:hypothetical protein